MIKYIRDRYVEGDQITIYFNGMEVSGVIDRLEEDAIFLHRGDGNAVAVNGLMIGGFSDAPYLSASKERKNSRASSNHRNTRASSDYQNWKEPQVYTAPQYVEPYKSESELEQEVLVYQEIGEIKDQILEELTYLLYDSSIDFDALIPEKERLWS